MTSRTFVQLVLSLLLADGIMAVAYRTWHIGEGWYMLAWLALTVLLFWPIHRVYP